MKRFALLAVILIATFGFGRASAVCNASVSLGSATAMPGSSGIIVPIRLTADQPTRGIEIDIIDNTPNLYITSAISRVPGYTCAYSNMGYNAPSHVLFYSFSLTPVPAGIGMEVCTLTYAVTTFARPSTYILHPDHVMVPVSSNEACRLPGDGTLTVNSASAFATPDAGVVVDDGVPF